MTLIRPGCCGLCGQPIVGRIENFKCMACGRPVHDECAQTADRSIADGRCGMCGSGGSSDGEVRPPSVQERAPLAAAVPEMPKPFLPPPPPPPKPIPAPIPVPVAMAASSPVQTPPSTPGYAFATPAIEVRPATPTFPEPATFTPRPRTFSTTMSPEEKQEDMRTLGRNLLIVGVVMALLGAGKWASIAAAAASDAPRPPVSVPILLLVVGAAAAVFGGVLRKRSQTG